MTDPRPPAAPPPVTIQRHANRRLYDAASLRYLSMDDVRRLVATGAAVVVRDAKTGEDVTHSVLHPLDGPDSDPGRATIDGLVALTAGDETATGELPDAVLDEADEVRHLIAVRIADARAAGRIPPSATLPTVWYRRWHDAVRVVDSGEPPAEAEPPIDTKPPGAGQAAPRRPIVRD